DVKMAVRGVAIGTRGAWAIPPSTPVVVVLTSPADLHDAVSALVATGQDCIVGYLVGGMQAWDTSGRPLESVEQMPIAELHERLEAGDKSLIVIDVREDSEWKEGHIPGAIHIPFHELSGHLDE